jgi:D-arabinose 1-dehydrogenase-like Zn-dependent alcohol dehydrogenase
VDVIVDKNFGEQLIIYIFFERNHFRYIDNFHFSINSSHQRSQSSPHFKQSLYKILAVMVSFTVYKGSKDGSIVKSSTSKSDLTGDQVLLRVTASGLCGTDEHYRTQDMVLGHEGCGVVEAVGPAVRHLKKGDRVGWGYEHDSCGTCDWCLSGRETFCSERAMYGFADLDQGSFATHAVWKEAFLFPLPGELTDEEAAPLMCGGATVFNALHMYDIQPTSRVGVIGIGGLGHLAIQFAAKMGCDVVSFSGTNSKKEEAIKLGAKEFFATKDMKELNIGKKIDCLLVTTSAQPGTYLSSPTLFLTF